MYDATTNECVLKTGDAGAPTATFSGRQAILKLNLVKGKEYNVIFWADKPGNSNYTFDADNQTITVNYDGITMGDEGRDAFFQVEKNVKVNGPITKTIELRRPFAQLNWGTDDKNVADASSIAKAEVKVSNVYTTLNLFSGVASGSTEMTFTMNDIPTGETFPVEGYEYLAMDYILTGVALEDDDVQHAQGEVLDECSMKLFDTEGQLINTVTVNNVPVQRNYRTNIVGSLLTANVNYTIVILPDYYEEANKVVVCKDAASFITAAKKGGSVRILEDIVLPSKLVLQNDVEIDLNGHTLTFAKTANGYNDGLSFVGSTAVVKGGTVECENSGSDAKYGNPIWATKESNITLEDVTVKGQICAYVSSGSTVTINSGTFASEGSQCVCMGAKNLPAGKVIINGGDFTSQAYNGVNYCLNVEDALLKIEGAKPTDYIEVKGGTFHNNYNPANSLSENPAANFVADGYQSVETSEGVWTVSKIGE